LHHIGVPEASIAGNECIFYIVLLSHLNSSISDNP